MRSIDLAKKLAIQDVLLTYYDDMVDLKEEELNMDKQERMAAEAQLMEEVVERINNVMESR